MKQFDLKVQFDVDGKVYQTTLKLDFDIYDTVDLTDLQNDIRKGIRSGTKSSKIIVL